MGSLNFPNAVYDRMVAKTVRDTPDFIILLGCVTSIQSRRDLQLGLILVGSLIICVKFEPLIILRSVRVQGSVQFKLKSPTA